MDEEGFTMADIPLEFKELRACLRCALIKQFGQFHKNGCENCPFLQMDGNTPRVEECTTAYFEGTLALIDPQRSWVAKWQRSTKSYPGLYAIDVAGALPEDAMDYCENMGLEYKSKRT